MYVLPVQAPSTDAPSFAAPAGRPRLNLGLLTAWLRDPYATVTWSGVIEAGRERDANVINLVASRLRSPIANEAPARVIFDLVGRQCLDGLVVFSEMLYHFASAQEMSAFLARYSPLPITSIGLLPGIPSVMLDLRRGVREMVAHLVNTHGYRRLAFLRGPAAETTAEAQYEGYVEGLSQFRIPVQPHLVTPPARHWGSEIGAEGVRVLLDSRGLQPGSDFQALVGCGDHEALAAITALEQRGWRVPADVAVTGFNNLEETRFATPGVTTIDRQISELARRATEMLLDLLAGQRVPHRTLLPPAVVVRRSCGCLPQPVADAAVEINSTPLVTPAGTLAGQRGPLAAAIAAAVRPGAAGQAARLNPKWSECLVDAFLSDVAIGTEGPWDDMLIKEQDPIPGKPSNPALSVPDRTPAGSFLALLEENLRRVSAANGDVAAWHGVLSALRRQAYPYLAGTSHLAQAENLWQQARVLVGDFAEREQGRDKMHAAEQVERLSDITYSLITTFDVAGLMDTLAHELPRLGIPGCYLSLYCVPGEPARGARLALAYDERGRLPLGPAVECFDSRELVPACAGRDRRRDLVVLPLYFQDEQMGFAVLEMGPRDGRVYEALRVQISSALKGASLMTGNARLYQEAVQARAQAEETNRLKSRFLSTISHELRTPLSLIVGTVDIVLHEEAASQVALADPLRRDLLAIGESARHLAHLIGDVLDLASSQAGELRLTCEPLRLGEVLGPIAALGSAMAREKSLAWYLDLPDELPTVWGDRTRLQQVTLNLVNNAVKFTKSGSVSLWAEVGQRQVVVAVSDTGMGIPPAEQEAIFDEFRQSERTVRRHFGGMGLGLAISRRLIELHAGQLGVFSSGGEGAGSTFYFTLPIPALHEQALAPTESTSRTVLVLGSGGAGDDRLCRHLAGRGFAVELVAVDERPNWLGRILAAPPAAVVLGLEPAGARGWELMQLLRQNPATEDIPVVFFSLLVELDRGAALEFDYLVKPAGAAELGRALARAGLAAESSYPGCTVLIVDDQPQILDLHSRILQGLVPQCRVLRARDGREALDLMAQGAPDLVLLDLMMPVMDGFAVLEAMRAHEPTRSVPVIVLTAQILTSQDMSRLQHSVAAVLSKDLYSGQEVLAQIEAVLNRSKRLGTETQKVVRLAMAYIHEHYAQSLTREELALQVGFSDRHLTHCFRQETGLTPMTYLMRYRVRQARMLLERGDLSIAEIAQATGWSEPNYFARVFRQEVGVPPSAYRRKRSTTP